MKAAVLVLAVSLLGCFVSGCSERPTPLTFEDFQKREANVVLQADGACERPCQRRRQEFRYVVYAGKQIYCYWDEKKAETRTDFDALATELERSITDTTTTTEYYRLLGRWAAAFHDGHVNAFAKKDKSELDLYTAPIRLELLAPGTDHEKVIVLNVNVEFDEQVPVGSLVTAVGDQTTKAALDAMERVVSGSTARMRRYKAAKLLVDAWGPRAGAEDLKLSFERGERKWSVTFPRTAELTPRSSGMPQPSGDAASGDTGLDNLKVKIFAGGLGYLWIGGFGGSQSEFLLDQAMDRLQGTRGLLIDLRQNHGGDLSGNRVLARLADKRITRYQRSERMSDFLIAARPQLFFVSWHPGEPFAAWRRLGVEPSPAPQHYVGPVVALIGTECFSACDTFAAALKDNSLATLVGEPTGGGTGTPHLFDLPQSGFQFRYSVVRGKTARGNLIEGNGTRPDHLVEPTVEDRTRRHDRQLTEGLRILQEKISPRIAPPTDLLSEARPSLRLSPSREEAGRLEAIAPFDELEPTSTR